MMISTLIKEKAFGLYVSYSSYLIFYLFSRPLFDDYSLRVQFNLELQKRPQDVFSVSKGQGNRTFSVDRLLAKSNCDEDQVLVAESHLMNVTLGEPAHRPTNDDFSCIVELIKFLSLS